MAFSAGEPFTHGTPAGDTVGIPMVEADALERICREVRMGLRKQPARLAVAAVGAQEQVEGQVAEPCLAADVVLKVDGFHLRFEVDRDARRLYLFVQLGHDMVPPMGVHPFADGGEGELAAQDTLVDDHPEELGSFRTDGIPDADLLQDANGSGREDDREGEALRLQEVLFSAPFEQGDLLEMLLEQQRRDHPHRPRSNDDQVLMSCCASAHRISTLTSVAILGMRHLTGRDLGLPSPGSVTLPSVWGSGKTGSTLSSVTWRSDGSRLSP